MTALVDPQVFQELFGVVGQLVETVMQVGLGGFAEADLVRRHHPEAVLDQKFYGVPPVGGGEVLAVQEHHGFAVARAVGLDVHVGHAQVLAFLVQVEKGHRVGVGVFLQGDGQGREVLGRGDPGGQPASQDQHEAQAF